MRRLIYLLLTLWGSVFSLSSEVPWQTLYRAGGGSITQEGQARELPTSSDNDPAVLVPSGERFGDIATIIAALSRLSPVASVAVAPDGRTIASGSQDNTIRLWDVASGKEFRRLEGHTAPVISIAFSSDGRRLASGSADKTIRLWDTASGMELQLLQGHTASVSSVAFAPDGRTLASGSEDKTILLWDAASGKELHRLQGHTASVSSVAFAPDGRSLASGSDDKTVRLWDAASGKQLLLLEGHTDEVRCVAFAPNGHSFASGSGDGTIRLWDATSGKQLARLEGHTASVTSVAFAPEGRILASGSDDKTIRLWDVAGGKEVQRLEGHKASVNSVAFSPDGRSLVSGSDDKTVRLWDAASGKELRRLEGQTARVNSVAFAPDRRGLASGSDDGTIRLWEFADGKQNRRLEGHTASINSVAFAPDGRNLASGSADGTVRLWDVASGKQLRRLEGQTGAVNSIAFAPDGRSIASGSKDGPIVLWDVVTGKEVRRLAAIGVNSVAFAPNGDRLASGSQDGTIELWEVSTGSELLVGRTSSVNSVAFAPDGRSLASGSENGTIVLWDLLTGKEPRSIAEPWVKSIAFAPDGRSLASGSSDGVIEQWDVITGKKLRSLRDDFTTVNSIAFAPDGRGLASGSDDGAIRIWDAAGGSQLALMAGGQRGLWISCRMEKDLCWRSDDGTLLAERDTNGVLQPVPPWGQQLDVDFPTASFAPSVDAIEGKTTPVQIKLRNVDASPLFWLNVRAGSTIVRDDAPSILFHPPATIARLEPGQSVTVEGWLSVSLPYLGPKPEKLALSLILEEAGGWRLALDPIDVSVKSPSPAVEEAHLSKTPQSDQTVVATLVNTGTAALDGFVTQGRLGSKAQLTEIELGSGSSPSADPSAPPKLDREERKTITFAVQKGVALPERPQLFLAVRAAAFPLHEWQNSVPIIFPPIWPMVATVAAGVIFLAGSAGLIYYQMTYRNPLLAGVSANPNQLLKLDTFELATVRSLLARTRRLDAVLREAEIAPQWLDDAVWTLSSRDPKPRAELLARRFEAQLTDLTSLNDLTPAYVLKLPDEFKLKVDECVLVFPARETAASDVLTAWRHSDYGRHQLITMILASDAEQRHQFQRHLDNRTESVLVLDHGDETSLLLGTKPLDMLARLISARIDPTRISPYQINAGIERETVFFGRTEQLKDILNRNPANYLVVGARQLGKSSLLLAIKRRMEQRGTMACEYLSVGIERFEFAIASRVGLDEDASLPEIVRALRNQVGGPPRLFLVDEFRHIRRNGQQAEPLIPRA